MNVPREIALFIDAAADGIIAINAEGVITLFNRAAARILRVDSHRALGADIRTVIPMTRLPAVIEARRAELDQTLTYRDVTIITSRYPIFDEDGAPLGAVAVFRDISEVRRLAEELTNLREMRIMNEAIFQSTQDAISVVDERGIGVQVNPAYTRVTGLRAEEVVGQPCTVDIASGESIHLQVLRTGRPLFAQRLRVGPARREVVVDAAPIVVDGTVKGSVAVIKDVSEIMRLHDQLADAQRTIRKLQARYTFEDVIGREPRFIQAVERARVAATTPATVILRGESGTGKELFAHAIHNASDRRNAKFIRVNCATLSESLLESELFGYVEGAFTGARKGGRRGLFEEATGGTIFLDEIALMSINTQAKLLRVLQEREVRPVGGADPIPIDVRVIAATNLDLGQAIRQGTFREDLYYRLHVVPITIPPLRHRVADIPVLTDALLRKINAEYGRAVTGVAPRALDLLQRYEWPGNVRELENVLRRALVAMRIDEVVLDVSHLNEIGAGAPGCDDLPVDAVAVSDIVPLDDAVAEIEARHIRVALEACGGNRQATAALLRVSLRTLQYKLKRYAIG